MHALPHESDMSAMLKIAPRPQLHPAASRRARLACAHHALQAWPLSCNVQSRTRVPFVRPRERMCAREGMRLIADIGSTLKDCFRSFWTRLKLSGETNVSSKKTVS